MHTAKKRPPNYHTVSERRKKGIRLSEEEPDRSICSKTSLGSQTQRGCSPQTVTTISTGLSEDAMKDSDLLQKAMNPVFSLNNIDSHVLF